MDRSFGFGMQTGSDETGIVSSTGLRILSLEARMN